VIHLDSEGTVVFTGDQVYMDENYEEGTPLGPPSCGENGWAESMNRIRELERRHDAEIVFGHDPEQSRRRSSRGGGVSYERSVSADPHRLSPETVWEVRMPAIRVGADAADELGYQLGQLGLSGDGRGLIVTDSDLVSLGHVDRVADELEADGFDVDVYDGVEREPSIEAVEVHHRVRPR